MVKKILLTLLILLGLALVIIFLGASSYETTVEENQYETKNFDFVGYHDLNGNSTFKMALHQVGEKWYLYCAHFSAKGWSIIDVTNPAQPRFVKFLKNPEKNTNNGQIQIADNLMITALERPLTDLLDIVPWQGYAWLVRQTLLGKLPYKPWAYTPNGVLIWDVADPENPKLLSKWSNESLGTHRNFYDGGDYLYLTANRQNFEGNFLIILDISNPKSPKEIGEYYLPGQSPLSSVKPTEHGYYLHGPSHVKGDTAYLPYGIEGCRILDITDKSNPKEIGKWEEPDSLGSPQGTHTFLPLTNRPYAIINSEAHGERCIGDKGKMYTAIMDLQDITQPSIVSFFPEPIPSSNLPYASFCEKGGRVGPHNQHHHNNNPIHFHSDTLVYLTSFNAGLRLYDISDVQQVKELGYFIPPNPTKRDMVLPSELVLQTEDVIVDKRGYAYISQKNDGIYIVKYAPKH